VRSLVDRGRGDKAIFDVLPPQRRSLAEKGLLGSSRRAVVVSLPTSSGKTMIAQFRILQALNQFEYEKGWVAYIAPTRALVNQITRQLRSDFAQLNIIVEKVSPALDIDSVEMDLLKEQNDKQKFRVLITTPEKLDLILRQGWEEKIGRPLTLVVVDEAHNIQSRHRGLKLELLLATINKECEKAQFLLLTPFIRNAREVARWLGGNNSDDISLSLDWQPNDRVIGIVSLSKGEELRRKGSFDYDLNFETVHSTRKTIAIDEIISIPKEEEIGRTFSQVNNKSKLSAIAAQYFKDRGPIIVMHSRPDWVWTLANQLKIQSNKEDNLHDDVKLLQEYLRLELGDSFPLIELVEYGIAVHHSGLPEEVRSMVEWLFENSRLKFLVATTTIAQGINFPVSGVVMASHQYFSKEGAVNMPPEDFWNIAGRAGRVSHGQLGVIALAADNQDKATELKRFINEQTKDLNSALIQLAKDTEDKLSDLGNIVYNKPEWSSFLQYLAHTYKQMGMPQTFFQQIEQVLRGTLGFEKLRTNDSRIAQKLLEGIEIYLDYLQRPGQPITLVDSTGFSLQSVNTVLTNRGNIDENSWHSEQLYADGDTTLKDMMGILLRVPELRDNLEAVTGGDGPDGDKLSLILKDWVNGVSMPDIASKYFREQGQSEIKAITRCGQNLFGKLTQTTSWGLSALLAITGTNLDESVYKELSNLPARAYYGVNSNEAIIFRLLGVPRSAASSMAVYLKDHVSEPLPNIRNKLTSLTDVEWNQAMGQKGKIYRKIWRILEGLD
jgi:superfamily II DNA/RNA helicase